MGIPLSEKVESNVEKFLSSDRLGVDFGDKAHGVSVVQGNKVIFGATLIDESDSDLKKRRQSRRGRRTRESRRQRLARLRQWCRRNHLPDPDPYVNREVNSVVWPPTRGGKPTSALKSLTKEQRKACYAALEDDPHWQQFLKLPPEAVNQCALINPFIARRLAREGLATPLVFVRALWHLFEHRGFDWYRRTRGEREEDDYLESKDALIRHLKTLVLPGDEDLQRIRAEIQERDKERREKFSKAKPWLDDDEVKKELAGAVARGKGFPARRNLTPPRHHVEDELKLCLNSLPTDSMVDDFGRKKDQPAISPQEKRTLTYHGLKKLLNWNRREPRFDNRQLRGCTWCAMRGIHRNTPRKKNVVKLLIEASIRDIKVAAGEAAKSAEAEAVKQKRVSRKQRMALTDATRALWTEEAEKIRALVFSSALTRDQLKEELQRFFKDYALLPKRVFVKEGEKVKKKLQLADPYAHHREELLNLADGLHHRRRLAGRVRFCEACLKVYAQTSPENRKPPVGESDVVLSQRLLKARCDRLVAWIKQNVRQQFPVEYIRIEAVLPRPEDKARLKAQAATTEPDQLPREKLKFRLMEEVGVLCKGCNKPYRKWKRRGPESKRDKAFCQCSKPDLSGRCAYCAEYFSPTELQIEHIYPKNPVDTSGGIGPDAQINKTVACSACNQGEKKNRLPFDYFQKVVGGNSWQEWKRRTREFNWPEAKRKVAILEEYRLPEELGDVALARTGLVHRYLRQKLAALFLPDQTKILKDAKAGTDQKNEAKVFLDQHMSTPAGWMTRQCRNDWEHIEEDGHVRPLVPRKSPLLTAEQREKRLQETLAQARNEGHRQDIMEGQTKRAKIEEQLRQLQKIAVCDRTNLNHHWIDAAVLASLPPQANQPVERGGIWVRKGREVRAGDRFAPRAAEFLERWGDGSVIFELGQHLPRFKERQQEESLYGPPRESVKVKEKAGFKPITIPKGLQEQAKCLPQEIFEFADGKLEARRDASMTHERAKAVLEAITNADLRSRVGNLLEKNYQFHEPPVIFEPVANLKVQDKEQIVSQHWRKVFGELGKREYDFPKKRSDEVGEEGESKTVKMERRLPKSDECLPPEAWAQWVKEKNAELQKRHKGEVSVPKRLRIYFEKLTPNEAVTFPGGEKSARSKRGIRKPRRLTRMTPVGSHAVIDPESGELTVVLNPWKRHVEKTSVQSPRGERVYKGDCIWHPGQQSKKRAKGIQTGWYRIIEMSPAKQMLFGKVKEPELKAVPAWQDLNQLVQNTRAQEPDTGKRKKITSARWEVPFNAAAIRSLAVKKQLKIKRRFEDLPGLVEESRRGEDNNGSGTIPTTGN